MMPQRMNRRNERMNLPVWLVVSGALALVALLFFGWVALGINSVPDPETVTVDVPLKV